LDFVPVFARASERYVVAIQQKGATMNQIANWMQSNWYELGSLMAQLTFVFAGLWFAGKILSTMRATQQQMGALLRLSMTEGPEEQHSRIEESSQFGEANPEPTPSVVASPVLSPAMKLPTSYSAFERPARTETPSRSNGWRGRAKASTPIASAAINSAANNSAPIASMEEPAPYTAAPLTLPEDEHNGGHLSAAVQWLQTPMAKKRNDVSSLKKVVRWLQAPAR